MNDKERTIESKAYHILIAVRRKKENRELQEIVFRQIIRDLQTDLLVLKARISTHPGTWRIYHTVNARLHAPARKLLMKRLIDFPEDSYRIDTLFKTMLLKPDCKATKYFLVDVDTKDKNVLNTFISDISKSESSDGKTKILKTVETPNGFHVVCTRFDTRLINTDFYDLISIQRDGYYLLEVIKTEK